MARTATARRLVPVASGTTEHTVPGSIRNLAHVVVLGTVRNLDRGIRYGTISNPNNDPPTPTDGTEVVAVEVQPAAGAFVRVRFEAAVMMAGAVVPCVVAALFAGNDETAIAIDVAESRRQFGLPVPLRLTYQSAEPADGEPIRFAIRVGGAGGAIQLRSPYKSLPAAQLIIDEIAPGSLVVTHDLDAALAEARSLPLPAGRSRGRVEEDAARERLTRRTWGNPG